jgi:hypothetical protein
MNERVRSTVGAGRIALRECLFTLSSLEVHKDTSEKLRGVEVAASLALYV